MNTRTFEVRHETTKIFEALPVTPVERGIKVRCVMKMLNLGEQKALYFLGTRKNIILEQGSSQ